MLMSHRQALEVLSRHRGDAVVLATMTAIKAWFELSDSPLDFAYMPSSMGQCPALGQGIALAQPERRVIVVNGDGSMLMNLGSLVTIAAYPANLFMLVMDNGIYEVTGGQATAGQGRVDFAALARAAGIQRVYAFDSLAAWEAGAPAALTGAGPVFIWLRVEARLGQTTPRPPRPMGEQIQRLRQALASRNS
jgi:thiamine pyrophosphate-dependent acetolactate synthase large subunit-like protein